MQSDVDRKLIRDSPTAQLVVMWSYNEHPSRWFVAVIALSYAATLSAGLFSGDFQNIESTQFANDHFVFTWVVVLVLLGLIVTSLRPRVEGCFVRRGNQFDFDSGRRAPDFLCALSFFSVWSKPRGLFTLNLAALGREYSTRFFPTRQKTIGQINEIEDVTLETTVLGPKIVLHMNDHALTLAEDVPAEKLKIIYEEIRGLIYQEKPP